MTNMDGVAEAPPLSTRSYGPWESWIWRPAGGALGLSLSLSYARFPGCLENYHNQYGRRRLSTTFIDPSKKIEKDVRILQMHNPISKREFHFKTRIPSKNEKPKPRKKNHAEVGRIREG